MKKRVLLSIHPEHADAIFEGHKRFEFRRVRFKEDVQEVVVYATSPTSRVVGRFTVEAVYVDSPSKLWIKTQASAGVTKQLFDSYFRDRDKGFAIKVSDPVRFVQPQPLSRYLSSNVPPQSFCYI